MSCARLIFTELFSCLISSTKTLSNILKPQTLRNLFLTVKAKSQRIKSKVIPNLRCLLRYRVLVQQQTKQMGHEGECKISKPQLLAEKHLKISFF
jgi:hypothetical protein